MVFNHHRTMIQNLLRLKPNTPQSVCYFLSGSLPAEAILHLRQLSILSMIMSAKDSILNKHGLNALNSKSSSRSWFHQVRDICLQYQLPHPMTLLHSSIPKESFRVLARKHVLNYWELKLRSEAAELPSLRYFKPEFMSLTRPHPIFLSAGSSPYEVTKAHIQALFLSGRYRTEKLCRHWSSNPEGNCLTPHCAPYGIREDEEHILLYCPALSETRQRLAKFTLRYAQSVPIIGRILCTYLQPSNPMIFQFLLDCSTIPEVIRLVQEQGKVYLSHLFKVTRTWCYSLHRGRLKILGRWHT